jgi:putative transposase
VGWRSSSHAKYDCKYHLIWCPKRRRVLGYAEVRHWVEETFRVIAEEFGFVIEELAVQEDHVHVFLEFAPKHSIARVVGILKSISASRTFHQFPWLRRKYWSGELWQDGYAARTVGDHVTADLIKRYIRRHDVEQATNQPELF